MWWDQRSRSPSVKEDGALMRTAFLQQRPLVPPPIAHPHAKEIQAVAATLESMPDVTEVVLQQLISAGVNPERGRQGMTADQVLRALVAKQVNKWTYYELEFHLADSATYRAFCGFGIADDVPSRSTLQRNIKAISPETLASVLRTIVGHALDHDVDDGNRARMDSTGVDAAIHEPTDSSLLSDCVRVLCRILRKAQRLAPFGFKNHHRRAKRRALEIQHAKSPEQREPLYRDLIKVTNQMVKAAVHAVETLQQALPERTEREQVQIARFVGALQYYILASRRVIDQTVRRVLQGESVPAQEKIVSIFEPHADIIVKDNRSTIYGHKVFLSTGESGLVFDIVMPRGNPADATLATIMVERHVDICGGPPDQVAFDGGFTSRANLEQIKKQGVEDVVFSKGKGIPVEEMAKSPRVYRELRNFRAGIEASISWLKRTFGVGRCDWRTFDSFRAYLLGSVIAANLLVIARAHAR
jgi:IS5 family transposase